MAMSESRITNSLCALPLVERINARIARTRALCATTVSLSSRGANTISCLSDRFFFVFGTSSSSLDARREERFSLFLPAFGDVDPSWIPDIHVHTFPLDSSFLQTDTFRTHLLQAANMHLITRTRMRNTIEVNDLSENAHAGHPPRRSSRRPQRYVKAVLSPCCICTSGVSAIGSRRGRHSVHDRIYGTTSIS